MSLPVCTIYRFPRYRFPRETTAQGSSCDKRPGGVMAGAARTVSVICPDCGQAVPKSTVQITWVPGIEIFGQCPLCDVGSPCAAWKPTQAI